MWRALISSEGERKYVVAMDTTKIGDRGSTAATLCERVLIKVVVEHQVPIKTHRVG